MARGKKAASAAAAATVAAPVSAMELNKENVIENKFPKSPHVPAVVAKKSEVESRNWEAELDQMTQNLTQLKLEKEAVEKLVQEQGTKIKEQQERIMAQSKEQEKLQEKLKKLQKAKDAPPPSQVASESSAASKGKKKEQAEKKKEKDPEKPKKPLSGYMVYAEERRPALKAENMKVPEMGRLLGEEWRNMDEEARAPYEQVAVERKAAYLEEMVAYNKKKTDEEMPAVEEKEEVKKVTKGARAPRKPRQTKQKAVEVEKPKKPSSAYVLFGGEFKKQLQSEQPKLPAKQLTSQAGSKWKEMSAEEKQPYVDQAAADKVKYDEAMAEYLKSGDKDEDDEDEDGSSTSS